MQYPQFAAHADMEERHWWFLARRHILRTLLHEFFPPSKNIHMIDVGCGTGGLTRVLSQEYTVIGVDPSADAIAFARERFPREKFIHGFAPKDVPDFGRADAILLIDVLEHVEKEIPFTKELIKHAKPGAIFMLMAPADSSLRSPHDEGFEVYRRYDSLRELRTVWEGTPMEELLVSFCNARLYPIVKWMRKISKLRGKSWGKGGTDIALPMAPVNALLKTIFAGEARMLLDILRRKRARGPRKGVSVIAVLRKR